MRKKGMMICPASHSKELAELNRQREKIPLNTWMRAAHKENAEKHKKIIKRYSRMVKV